MLTENIVTNNLQEIYAFSEMRFGLHPVQINSCPQHTLLFLSNSGLSNATSKWPKFVKNMATTVSTLPKLKFAHL